MNDDTTEQHQPETNDSQNSSGNNSNDTLQLFCYSSSSTHPSGESDLC